jgi:hypothetical protein
VTRRLVVFERARRYAAAAPPVTLAALLANAEPGVREVITEGLATLQEQRTGLITTIVGNTNNQFTADELGRMPLKMLRGIAAVAKQAAAPVGNAMDPYAMLLLPPGAPVANYAGAAGGPVGPIANVAESMVLPPPTMFPK